MAYEYLAALGASQGTPVVWVAWLLLRWWASTLSRATGSALVRDRGGGVNDGTGPCEGAAGG
jgi:hypothetical protein